MIIFVNHQHWRCAELRHEIEYPAGVVRVQQLRRGRGTYLRHGGTAHSGTPGAPQPPSAAPRRCHSSGGGGAQGASGLPSAAEALSILRSSGKPTQRLLTICRKGQGFHSICIKAQSTYHFYGCQALSFRTMPCPARPDTRGEAPLKQEVSRSTK